MIVGIVLLVCASGWCEFFVFVVVDLVGLHVCGICSLMWFRAWSLGFVFVLLVLVFAFSWFCIGLILL